LGVDGDEEEAGPGQALQRKLGERFVKMPVAVSSLAEFRDKWYADEIDALRSNPVKALKQFADFYQKKKGDFANSYALLEKSDALKRWIKEDETPNFKVDPKSAQTLKDLKEISGPLMAIRKDLVMFERYYYRLDELKAIVQDSAYWKGELAKDSKGNVVTVEAFYRVFDGERDALGKKLAVFRYAELLNLRRNPSGSTGIPGGAEGGDFFQSNDNFFGN
jgi:hypothetical protein